MKISDLTTLEIFDYYDRPLFYSCTDSKKKIYLAFIVDWDKDIFWFVKVDNSVYERLLNNKISVRKAFREAKTMFIADLYNNPHLIPITIEQVQDDWMPDDFFLNKD